MRPAGSQGNLNVKYGTSKVYDPSNKTRIKLLSEVESL